MRTLGGLKLLILDDWGGLVSLGPEQRHDMPEIVEDRDGCGAVLITSQLCSLKEPRAQPQRAIKF